MKAIATCCLWIIGCSFALADNPPDPTKGGSYSHLFSHSLVFEAAKGDKEARFVAMLTNVSDHKLNVLVNDREFHATLIISSPAGKPYKAYDAKYLGLLLTSVWSEPIIELEPKKTITWMVPLSSLRTQHDKTITHESLLGCTVLSDMNVAVVPSSRTFADNNATQKSKPIVIAQR
jgi:hypothetical protein|uniref:hypothetical protein n=1 Tax=Prosthecobacter sp. TaxID=1965333 RepID=UPI00378492D0